MVTELCTVTQEPAGWAVRLADSSRRLIRVQKQDMDAFDIADLVSLKIVVDRSLPLSTVLLRSPNAVEEFKENEARLRALTFEQFIENVENMVDLQEGDGDGDGEPAADGEAEPDADAAGDLTPRSSQPEPQAELPAAASPPSDSGERLLQQPPGQQQQRQQGEEQALQQRQEGQQGSEQVLQAQGRAEEDEQGTSAQEEGQEGQGGAVQLPATAAAAAAPELQAAGASGASGAACGLPAQVPAQVQHAAAGMGMPAAGAPLGDGGTTATSPSAARLLGAYRGSTTAKKPLTVQVVVNKINISLGTYATCEAAGMARDLAVIWDMRQRGVPLEGRKYNFPLIFYIGNAELMAELAAVADVEALKGALKRRFRGQAGESAAEAAVAAAGLVALALPKVRPGVVAAEAAAGEAAAAEDGAAAAELEQSGGAADASKREYWRVTSGSAQKVVKQKCDKVMYVTDGAWEAVFGTRQVIPSVLLQLTGGMTFQVDTGKDAKGHRLGRGWTATARALGLRPGDTLILSQLTRGNSTCGAGAGAAAGAGLTAAGAAAGGPAAEAAGAAAAGADGAGVASSTKQQLPIALVSVVHAAGPTAEAAGASGAGGSAARVAAAAGAAGGGGASPFAGKKRTAEAAGLSSPLRSPAKQLCVDAMLAAAAAAAGKQQQAQAQAGAGGGPQQPAKQPRQQQPVKEEPAEEAQQQDPAPLSPPQQQQQQQGQGLPPELQDTQPLEEEIPPAAQPPPPSLQPAQQRPAPLQMQPPPPQQPLQQHHAVPEGPAAAAGLGPAGTGPEAAAAAAMAAAGSEGLGAYEMYTAMKQAVRSCGISASTRHAYFQQVFMPAVLCKQQMHYEEVVEMAREGLHNQLRQFLEAEVAAAAGQLPGQPLASALSGGDATGPGGAGGEGASCL